MKKTKTSKSRIRLRNDSFGKNPLPMQDSVDPSYSEIEDDEKKESAYTPVDEAEKSSEIKAEEGVIDQPSEVLDEPLDEEIIESKSAVEEVVDEPLDEPIDDNEGEAMEEEVIDEPLEED